MIIPLFLRKDNKYRNYKDGAKWRFALMIESDQFGIVEQRWSPKSKEWDECGNYYIVEFRWRGKGYNWGRHHAYYDGPHDSLSLGLIHFCWSNEWCERCAKGI